MSEARKVPQFNKILFPTDFSESGYAALPYAQWLASQSEAEIHLLHVVQEVPVLSEFGMYFQGGAFQTEEFVKAAEARLKVEKTRFGSTWKPVQLHVLLGDPADQIDAFARENGCDVIVMASHQPSLLERFFGGSVSAQTVTSAPCPILVVPAPELE